MGSKLLYSLPALLLALLALILAVVGLSQSSKSEKAGSQPARQQTQQAADQFHYWVLTQPLKAGDTLSTDQLAVVSSPTAVPGAIGSDTRVAGRRVARFSRPGELLTKSLFEPGGSLPSMLPPGQRAMAIKVDDVSGAGGLLQPGDTVDVVTAFRHSQNKKGPAALITLRGITVLAVHGRLSGESGKKNDNRRHNDTVVLAVPRDKIPRLLLASSEGQVRLAVVARRKAAQANGTSARVVASSQDNASNGNKTAGPFYFNDFFPAPRHKPATVVHHRPRGYRVQVFEGAETRSTYVH